MTEFEIVRTSAASRAARTALHRVGGVRGVRVTRVPGEPRARLLQRIQVCAEVLPSDGIVVGWAAAVLHGFPEHAVDGQSGRGGELDVDVAVPRTSTWKGRQGMRRRCSDIPAAQRAEVGGIPVTSIERTLLDLARWTRSPGGALGRLDAALGAGLTDADTFGRFLDPLGGLHGLSRVRGLLRWVSPRAESVPESVLRHTWLSAKLPPLLVNPPLYDGRGRFLGRPDLLDDAAGLALEYQGLAFHAGRDESARFAAFEALGLEVVQVWRDDLAHPKALGERLRRLRETRLEALPPQRWFTPDPELCRCPAAHQDATAR